MCRWWWEADAPNGVWARHELLDSLLYPCCVVCHRKSWTYWQTTEFLPMTRCPVPNLREHPLFKSKSTRVADTHSQHIAQMGAWAVGLTISYRTFLGGLKRKKGHKLGSNDLCGPTLPRPEVSVNRSRRAEVEELGKGCVQLQSRCNVDLWLINAPWIKLNFPKINNKCPLNKAKFFWP